MKTIQNILFGVTAATIAASLLLVPAVANADARGGATRQLTLTQPVKTETTAAAATTSAAKIMSCSKCTDSKTSVTEVTFKAAHPTVTHDVLMHQCPGCGIKVTSTGAGKTASAKTTHECVMDGKSSACCAMK